MKRSVMIVAVAAGLAFSGQAQAACESMQDAMARFEEVKDDYIKMAPTMKPEQFAIWTKHLTTFGDSMGKMDYSGACVALDAAAVDLGLSVAPTAAAGGDSGKSSGGGKSSDGGGKGGGKGGADTAATPVTGGETPTIPAPSGGETATMPAPSGGETATMPAPSGGETAAAPSAGIPGVWQECPRGRCR